MNERLVGPGHHVDETGCYGEPLNVDFKCRCSIADITQGNDLVAIDCNIANERVATTTVVDIAAAKNEIV